MDCLESLTDLNEQVVDADAFFGEIAARLAAHFRQVGTPVSIHVDAQIVDLPVTLAEDLGRIAEVLLQNVWSHGRSADGSATAWLSFHIHRNLIHLDVEDQGRGLQEGFALEGRGSAGFRELNALVQFHGGVTRWHNPKGARISICIPQPTADHNDRVAPSIMRDDLHARRSAKQTGG